MKLIDIGRATKIVLRSIRYRTVLKQR